VSTSQAEEIRVDWDHLHRIRPQRVQAALGDAGIDALLSQRFDNLKYLTDYRPFTSLVYYPQYAAFLPSDGRQTLLTEVGDFALHTQDMPWIEDLRTWSYDLSESISSVAELIRETGLEEGTIAYDDAVSPAVISSLSEEFPQASFVDGTDVLAGVRAVKDPEELKALRQATDVAAAGIAAGIAAVKPGVKECEVGAELARAVLAAGADALIAHPQISTDPLRRMATEKPIEEGELVLIDVNVSYHGYIGDLARTVAVSDPTPEQRKTYQTQVQCVQGAIELVRDKADTHTIQERVVGIAEESGLGEYYHGYITGHGVGTTLAPLEQPIIGTTMGSITTLSSGMVIAFEPGFFRPSVGPVRTEEVVVVTDDGSESLSSLPHDERLMA
jgi:Xaa-Pro aminopeptidase